MYCKGGAVLVESLEEQIAKIKKVEVSWVVGAHTINPSTREAETVGSL